MHKKPIYGGRIYSDTYNPDMTFCDFLKKVIQHHLGLSGAAQNMDLFMHTRPLSGGSMQLEGLDMIRMMETLPKYYL